MSENVIYLICALAYLIVAIVCAAFINKKFPAEERVVTNEKFVMFIALSLIPGWDVIWLILLVLDSFGVIKL